MKTKQKMFVVSPRLWRACFILLALSLIVFSLTTFQILQPNLTVSTYEKNFMQYINGLPDSLRVVFITITFFGSLWIIVLVGLIATLLKKYTLAWWLVFSSSIVGALSAGIKFMVDRGRPDVIGDGVIVRVIENSPGYPSMHVAIATIVSLTLFFYFPKVLRYFVVFFWIGFVALSRLYLGVHMPLDIIGGAMIAVIIFCILRLLPLNIRIALRLASDEHKEELSDKVEVKNN